MASKKITDETIIKIWEDLKNGKSITEIAKTYNVSEVTVSRIKNKKYVKYKKVIEEYENNKKVKEIKEDPKNTKKVKFKKEEIYGILLKTLEPIFQPIILKFILDNILKNKTLDDFLTAFAEKEYEIQEFNDHMLKLFVIILNTTLKDKPSELILQNLDNIQTISKEK